MNISLHEINIFLNIALYLLLLGNIAGYFSEFSVIFFSFSKDRYTNYSMAIRKLEIY